MKVTLVVDGETTHLEVDLEGGTARVGERSFPFQVITKGPNRVELEIDGEKVVVDNWPTSLSTPAEPVTVNGERFAVRAEAANAQRPAPAYRPGPLAAAAPPVTAPPSGAPPPSGGTAVVPPMPGKVVELRVAEGDRVTKGQVLLVLEAMKMRNEIVSPSDGLVSDVRVRVGLNVRAREPMLVIAPGGS